MTHDSATHLDLFSGIGGFTLALEAAGFRTVAFSEVDPYASAWLRKRWPHIPNLGDIANIDVFAKNPSGPGFGYKAKH